jgi:hypothetical protein
MCRDQHRADGVYAEGGALAGRRGATGLETNSGSWASTSIATVATTDAQVATCGVIGWCVRWQMEQFVSVELA